MKVKPLLIGVLCSTLMACQNTEVQNETPEAPKDVKPPKVVCGASPPILDTSKLEAMLEKNGTIQPSMSSEEKEKIVREYIRKATKAYRNCSKGKKK